MLDKDLQVLQRIHKILGNMHELYDQFGYSGAEPHHKSGVAEVYVNFGNWLNDTTKKALSPTKVKIHSDPFGTTVHDNLDDALYVISLWAQLYAWFVEENTDTGISFDLNELETRPFPLRLENQS